MANPTIEKYLPRTARYIERVLNEQGEKRGGHHNHVINQRILSGTSPSFNLQSMSEDSLLSFDASCLNYLQVLDNAPPAPEL